MHKNFKEVAETLTKNLQFNASELISRAEWKNQTKGKVYV